MLGPEALARLKAAAGPEAAAKLDRAPTLVAASAVQDGDPVENEENRDAAAAACYIVLLAAHDRGLGGYWRTPACCAPRRAAPRAGSRTARRSSGCSTSARPRGRSPRPGGRRSTASSPISRERPGPDPPRRRPAHAARRRAAADGHRQRDAGLVLRRRRAPRHSRRAIAPCARARSPPGRGSSTSAASRASASRPAVDAEEEIARVVPLIERIARRARRASSRSTPTSRRSPRRRSRRARCIVNDVSGLRDPALAERLRRGPAPALVLMHTRVAPKGTLLDPGHYDDVVADVARLPARADRARARAAGVAPEQILLDPGPDFAKTPAQTVAVLRRARRRCTRSAARCCWRSRARTSSARSPGAARASAAPARSPRSAAAADAGAHVLRVHDVAAAADFLAVRAVLRGERELAPDAGLTPERYPDGSAACRALGATLVTLPAAAHNAAGAPPTTDPKEYPMSSVLDRAALEQSPLADLHLIANELGVDGFRRLRKAELIDAIVARQSGGDDARRGRGARPPRSPRPSAAADAPPRPTPRPTAEDDAEEARRRGAPPTRTRPRRGAAAAARAAPRGRGAPRRGARGADAPSRATATRVVEGVVELLGNGSGFIRLDPPETDRRRRLRLRRAGQALRARVAATAIAGPRARAAPLGALPVARPRRHDQRPPGRRGRRGHAASRTCRPRSRPSASRSAPRTSTLKAVEWLTPFGKGSRVVIAGAGARRQDRGAARLAAALAGREGLEVLVVLAGVRPEEIARLDASPRRPPR